MPKVFLSPSNQIANVWCTKDTNEAAEAVKFADALQAKLEERGIEVVRADDTKPFYSGDTTRGRIAEAAGCDAYIPLHTNAYNGTARGCRLYVYKKNATDENLALRNLDLENCLFETLAGIGWEVKPRVYQDYAKWGEMNNADAAVIPCVYSESIFHDNKDDVAWYRAHFEELVQAYCDGICQFVGPAETAEPEADAEPETEPEVIYRVQVGAFRDKANAEAFLKTVQEKGFTNAFIV